MIGGSGFYDFFDDPAGVTEVAMTTPFGPPSDAPVVGEVAAGGSRSWPGTAKATGSRRIG